MKLIYRFSKISFHHLKAASKQMGFLLITRVIQLSTVTRGTKNIRNKPSCVHTRYHLSRPSAPIPLPITLVSSSKQRRWERSGGWKNAFINSLGLLLAARCNGASARNGEVIYQLFFCTVLFVVGSLSRDWSKVLFFW